MTWFCVLVAVLVVEAFDHHRR